MWAWILKLLPVNSLIGSLFTGKGGMVILLVVGIAAGAAGGWYLNGWRWESKQAGALQALIDSHNKDIAIRDKINEKLRAQKEKVKVKRHVVEKEIIKYIQTPRASELCFDDDELRLFNGDASEKRIP